MPPQSEHTGIPAKFQGPAEGFRHIVISHGGRNNGFSSLTNLIGIESPRQTISPPIGEIVASMV